MRYSRDFRMLSVRASPPCLSISAILTYATSFSTRATIFSLNFSCLTVFLLSWSWSLVLDLHTTWCNIYTVEGSMNFLNGCFNLKVFNTEISCFCVSHVKDLADVRDLFSTRVQGQAEFHCQMSSVLHHWHHQEFDLYYFRVLGYRQDFRDEKAFGFFPTKVLFEECAFQEGVTFRAKACLSLACKRLLVQQPRFVNL